MTPAFAAALVMAQGEIEGAKKDSRNPGFNSKYADLSSCWDACRDALQKNGIAVLQWPSTVPGDYVGMVTQLVYGPTGEVLSGEFQLPLGGKKDAQAAGSAITYARRYALCSVIGICPEDDDGNAASAPRKVRSDGSTAVGEAEVIQNEKLEAAYEAQFGSLTSNDERKALYSTVKNSGLAEPCKTRLLAKMADVIKKEKAQ